MHNQSFSTRVAFGATLLAASVLMVSCSCMRNCCVKKDALFNGTDLSNWTAVSAKPDTRKEDVWSVRDGIIVCKGEPMGYIQSNRQFQDFRLRVDWRWAPGKTPGNSGIFLRINGAPKALPRCVECQLKSGDAGDLYGFHGMQLDGDPARRKTVKGHELGGDFTGVTKIAGNEKPPGDWNHADILVQGGNVKVWVNGKLVNEAVRCEDLAGPVGLQSEGGEVHFRNVTIQQLKR